MAIAQSAQKLFLAETSSNMMANNLHLFTWNMTCPKSPYSSIMGNILMVRVFPLTEK
jgi:hypothetical protein